MKKIFAKLKRIWGCNVRKGAKYISGAPAGMADLGEMYGTKDEHS